MKFSLAANELIAILKHSLKINIQEAHFAAPQPNSALA